MSLEEIKRSLGLEIYQALYARPDKDPRRDPQTGEKLWIAAAGPMVDYLYLASGSAVQGLHWVTNIGNTTTNALLVSASGSTFSTLTVFGNTTVGGVLDTRSNNIINVLDPVNAQDASTKNYVDTVSGSIGTDLNHQVLELYEYVDDNIGASTDTLDDVVKRGSYTNHGIQVDASGSRFYNLTIASGSIDMVNHTIVNVLDPVNDQDAVTKSFMHQTHEASKEPTGFPNRTDSTINFSSGSRVLEIEATSGTFDYYIHGTKYTISGSAVKLSDTEGTHFIALDTNEKLVSTTTFTDDIFTDYAITSIVHWNADDDEPVYYAEERHGMVMGGVTHAYLHNTVGTRYESGLSLNTFDADGNGDDATAAQFGYASGIIWDEDLKIEISTDTAPAQIPVLYRSGSAGKWRRTTATDYPLIYNGHPTIYTETRAGWNEYTGGIWQLTEVGNNNFVLIHYFASNDIDYPIVGICGQTEYTTIIAAREGALTEINSLITTGLPLVEFKAVATVIFQTSTAYSNTPKARVRTDDVGEDWTDWRFVAGTASAGSQINDHSQLTGLDNDDHTQYSLVDGSRSFTGTVEVSGSLSVDGSIRTNSGMHINYNGPEGDSFLYFYENSSVIGASLMWDDNPGEFVLNQPLSMDVNQIHDLASPSGSFDAANKSYVDTVSGSIGQDLNHQVLESRHYTDTVSGSIGTDIASNYATKNYVGTVSGSIGEDLNHQVLESRHYTDTVSGSIGTDLNHQVLELYEYVDDNIGGTQDLQDVCDLGAVTTTDITAANLKSNGDVYINQDNSDDDATIRFYKPTSGYETFQFDKDTDRFRMTNDFYCEGYIKAGKDLWTNAYGADAEGVSRVFFWSNGSPMGARLSFHDIVDAFYFTHKVGINAPIIDCALTINSGSYPQVKVENDDPDEEVGFRLRARSAGDSNYCHGDITIKSTADANDEGYIGFKVPYNNTPGTGYKFTVDHNGDIRTYDSIYIGSLAASDDDSYLYFYENSSETGASLMWDDDPGEFVLSHQLSMATHKIVDVVDPTEDQDVATKKYVDTVSGSIGTDLNHQVLELYEYVDDNIGGTQDLQDVCDLGAVTTTDITAANLKSNGDVYINHNGPESDSTLYFYNNADPGGAWLHWDDSHGFRLHPAKLGIGAAPESPLHINDSTANNQVKIENDGPDEEAGIRLRARNAGNTNYLHADIGCKTTGTAISEGYIGFKVPHNNTAGTGYKFTVDHLGDIRTYDSLYIGSLQATETDRFIYFYEGGSETGASLKWDTTYNRFEFNSLVQATTFHATGYVRADYDMYINYNGGDADSSLFFYEGGSNEGAYLKWDDDPGNFAMNKGLMVGDGGATNYTEIKDDGEINLHGTARVKRHISIPSPSWKIGVTGPTEGYVGIAPILAFDASTDDSVHYNFLCPHRMAAGTDIRVFVDWCYTGAAEHGTVMWAVEYINIDTGETVAGSTTTFSKVSGNVYTLAGKMIRASFDTDITGAVAHDVIAIRLYRDVSGDSLTQDAKMIQVHLEFTMDKLGEATT